MDYYLVNYESTLPNITPWVYKAVCKFDHYQWLEWPDTIFRPRRIPTGKAGARLGKLT